MDQPPPGQPLRPARPHRDQYRWYKSLPTRWMDNDMYGHVNNVVYYSYFDTAVGHFLIEECGFDPYATPILDFVVDSSCRYHAPVAFPDLVHAGLRVGRLGRTSVRWEIALFRNDDDMAAADGHFVHVFVDKAGQRPVPIPDPVRRAMEALTAG
jgi:acyl-CoA thioester hydrolase